MHTFYEDGKSIHHNGDYSGDVKLDVHESLVTFDPVLHRFEIQIPADFLLEWAAEAKRSKLIAELEQRDWQEL